jgi:hypothetical protein
MPTMKASSPSVTVADLSLAEKMGLVVGWLPPGGSEPGGSEPRPRSWNTCRWRSWREYLDAFAAVEAELYERFAHARRPIFAERARAYRERFGAEALDRAAYTDISHHGEVEA